jgi:hypothetical protein
VSETQTLPATSSLSRRDVALGLGLGVVGLLVSTFMVVFTADASSSAPLPVGFVVAALLLIVFDVVSRRRHRTRLRLTLGLTVVGLVLGYLGWGVRVERITGMLEGRVVTIHCPPFLSTVRSTVRATMQGPGPSSESSVTGLTVTNAYAIDEAGLRTTSSPVGRLQALGAHLDVAGATVTNASARLAFGYELRGPDGVVLASQPLPQTPDAIAPIAAPYGTSAYHIIVWPSTALRAGRYTFTLTAWDADSGAHVSSTVALDYERPSPPVGARISSLIFTQPDHEDRAQPAATYAQGDTVAYNVLVACGQAAAAAPCHSTLRATLEPLAPTPGADRIDTLPTVDCSPDDDGLCAPSFYIAGLAVGRYHLVIDATDSSGRVEGDFYILPPDQAPPRDLQPASGPSFAPVVAP